MKMYITHGRTYKCWVIYVELIFVKSQIWLIEYLDFCVVSVPPQHLNLEKNYTELS